MKRSEVEHILPAAKEIIPNLFDFTETRIGRRTLKAGYPLKFCYFYLSLQM